MYSIVNPQNYPILIRLLVASGLLVAYRETFTLDENRYHMVMSEGMYMKGKDIILQLCPLLGILCAVVVRTRILPHE